jgi:hypothetical protein
VLGGIGSIPGAMLGGVLLGLAETFAAGYMPAEYKDVVAFGLLVLVLLFRPTGLLGKPDVEKVWEDDMTQATSISRASVPQTSVSDTLKNAVTAAVLTAILTVPLLQLKLDGYKVVLSRTGVRSGSPWPWSSCSSCSSRAGARAAP